MPEDLELAAEETVDETRRGRPSSRASDRLRRLLVVVPFVVRHPGAEVSELSRLFGVAERELLDDLNLLFMSGLPPYGPGDLIEVDVEEGRVWIGMAEYFARAVRLTRAEALALYLRGKGLLGAPGLKEAPALASALLKIEQALGPDSLGSLSGRIAVGAGSPTAETLATIRAAVEDHRRVDIEYYTAARDELGARRIDPEHLFMASGNWYVVAWDERSDDERLFRVDRIRAATALPETFSPRGLEGMGRALYTRSERDIAVRLRLGLGARWVAEYYEVEGRTEGPNGTLDVTLPAKALPWVAKLILQLGDEAEVLDPPELARLVRETARAALRRYRRPSRA